MDATKRYTRSKTIPLNIAKMNINHQTSLFICMDQLCIIRSAQAFNKLAVYIVEVDVDFGYIGILGMWFFFSFLFYYFFQKWV